MLLALLFLLLLRCDDESRVWGDLSRKALHKHAERGREGRRGDALIQKFMFHPPLTLWGTQSAPPTLFHFSLYEESTPHLPKTDHIRSLHRDSIGRVVHVGQGHSDVPITTAEPASRIPQLAKARAQQHPTAFVRANRRCAYTRILLANQQQHSNVSAPLSYFAKKRRVGERKMDDPTLHHQRILFVFPFFRRDSKQQPFFSRGTNDDDEGEREAKRCRLTLNYAAERGRGSLKKMMITMTTFATLMSNTSVH